MYSSNAKKMTQEEIPSSEWHVWDGKSTKNINWIKDTTLTCHLNYGKLSNFYWYELLSLEIMFDCLKH